jgi:zinc protease
MIRVPRNFSVLRSTYMLTRLVAVVLGGLLLAGCAATSPEARSSATPSSATPAPTGPAAAARPRREVLPNGLVLISHEHRAADVVALQLWVRAGGRDEGPGELGLTHYMEHMLFKGTPTRPPGSIDILVEGLGGTSNAFTSYDYTHYDLVVPVRALRTGLEVLADIGVNASFPPAEIDAEKAVVHEEMRLVEDDPEKFAARRLGQLAYAPHPYGRPILGTREGITALTREPLVRYYKTYYVPSNMVLVAVGAATHAEIRAAVDATFGTLPGGEVQRRQLAPPPPIGADRREDVRRPEQQAYLAIGWQAASTNHPDTYAVDLLTYILGDSPSSRLNQALRERDRLVFSIESNYIPSQQAGLVSILARLDPSNVDKAEASIREVIRRVREQGVTEAERERAVITAESHYAFDIETAEGVARYYGQGETTWTLEDELRYLERLRKVTAPEIQAMARKYLGDDNYARVRFVPAAAPAGGGTR